MGLHDSRIKRADIKNWNRAVERTMVRQFRELSIPTDPSGIVFIQNASGNDREWGEVMALDEPMWRMDLDSSLVFYAKNADRNKRPVVLLEPIKNGEIGRGVINGLALAWVQNGPIATRSVEVDSSNPTLKPSVSGPIPLLGMNRDTGGNTLLPIMLGDPPRRKRCWELLRQR